MPVVGVASKLRQPASLGSKPVSIKSQYQPERTPEGKSRAETEESKICKVSEIREWLCFCVLVGAGV
ncbi:hypothetical protein JOQ06_026064 [Pogonophryne albipinna]|uniref:Uncharacterized protein n=1 Tax=Pogonophryne albipinna TaxID=1090488 RepID=A0AAD6A6X4_9TELE|nr:hypothetical protein JOQ06_026064 [Pogonophryne albipinna]